MPPRKNFYRSDPSNHGDEIAEAANDALRSRPARRRARGAPSWDAAPRPRTLPRAAAAASSVRKQMQPTVGFLRVGNQGKDSVEDASGDEAYLSDTIEGSDSALASFAPFVSEPLFGETLCDGGVGCKEHRAAFGERVSRVS